MYKIIYHVPTEEKINELDWLRDNMVFPAIEDFYDFNNDKLFVRVGCIIDESTLLTLKLRHRELKFQTEYVQGQGKKR